MAHHGILFLDELPEFSRDALEALREPLETMEVSIARVRARLRLPADFILVAAMNPCPCGYFGVQHPRRHCKCTPDRVSRYRSKISGPLLDRFDLAIGLEPGPKESSADEPTTNKTQRPEASETMAIRVALAQTRQADRQRRPNARLSPRQVHEVARLDPQGAQLFEKTAQHWGWSARARDRTLRVARTIADLAQSEDIDLAHLGEAIELRRALDLAAGV
jgi:magnesium chelatase family protein